MSEYLDKIRKELEGLNTFCKHCNGISLHTLRHTCGTWLALNNFSEIQIAGVLGHALSSVTARYVHVAAETRKMLELVESISFYP